MKRKYSNALKKYSSLTGTALIAGTKIAQAQVIYTDENPDLVVSLSTVNIDINNDGQMDIGLEQADAFYNYARLTKPSGSTAQVLMYGVIPHALASSTSISSTSTAWTTVFNNALESEWTGYGNFGGAGDRYVGVKFQILGEYHYGWVLINVPTDASTITLKSYAYNATPGVSIVTGETSSAAPTLDIQGEPTLVNSLTPFGVTFQFDQYVSGFDINDIVIGNGTVSNFQTTNAGTYTADITPDGNGDITIDVAGSAAQSIGTGNANSVSTTQAVIVFDATAPTVAIQSAPSIVNSNASFNVTFQFSEDVTGFDVSDIVVGNGAVGNFQTTNASTYTADITPDGNGDITIDVAGSVAQDGATNNNTAATQVLVTYDATAPTVTIQSVPASVNNTSPFSVTFQFSEDVTGFDVSDIVVGNGSAGNFQTTNGSTYTADITPDGNGDITIDVSGSVAQDVAANDNTAASQVTVTYSVTGVELDNKIKVTAYPNPTSNTIQFSGVDVQNIKVFDGNGVLVLESHSSTIDLAGHAVGTYYALVQTSDGSQISKRIVKN